MNDKLNAESQRTILKVKDLEVSFSTRDGVINVVDKISFEIKQGESFALLGESGCGKSITALSIMQLLPEVNLNRFDGSIKLYDDDLLDSAEREMRKVRGRRIAMIFQEPMTSLNPVMTVGEQIGEVLAIHIGLRGDNKKNRVLELLNDVGMIDPEHTINNYPHQLSGGMKQRVMIAMALAGDPELLIADEPTTALDVTIQAQILKLLRKLQQERGMSILLITHDFGVVAEMADRVAVMYAGKLVEQNSKRGLFSSPIHPYTKSLFAALPQVTEREQDKSEGALLKVEQLKVHFPIKRGLFHREVGAVRAVDGVDLTIYPARTLALVGESGSGKSTIGRAILRLQEPTAGEVEFESRGISKLRGSSLKDFRSKVQMIFQDPYSSMNPRMLIADIIGEGMDALTNYRAEERDDRVVALLEQVGLSADMAQRYPHEFSGGQRQRIAIARALAVDPKLIVCDEPTSALDVSVQAQIIDLLRDLQQKRGLSYLFITHNLPVVSWFADSVAVMKEGKIVERGSVKQVMNNPQHPYTKALLDAVPQMSV
ncbi:MAG: ABC transporter ATP-binding protein [Thiotrichales bacterium]|jgi:ABC-type microcin C transport system duplicated ATPase subunit YejF|nr:ABC transporter ATP-binding protein [Thiotrichales bacterium]MBT3613716.1 ABC transporter ATP-binding protein [Thiotrichales bacterium]MBT3753098.1 ABC transporter ATP-binding protein [Thiotrichales bacterium]MBT3838278.1 ABC transporter ATP-binding protein [Thiotrichales bacterium]MBT4151689.1 ABC transporter ATP-binding protein [Thiotrichales bacterium]